MFTHGGVVRLLAREVGEDRFVPTGTLLVVDWDARKLALDPGGRGHAPGREGLGHRGEIGDAHDFPSGRNTIDRRGFLGVGALGGAATLTGACRPSSTPPGSGTSAGFDVPAFEFDEATVADLQAKMGGGELTSRRLTEAYLARIEALDRQGPSLASVIETNPRPWTSPAPSTPSARPRECAARSTGFPVLIKDNIDTADRMTTTAGSLALEGSIPEQDSHVARRLREAGAVILGQGEPVRVGQLPLDPIHLRVERARRPVPQPLRPRPQPVRLELGSGVAVSANLCAVAVGTETDGSIVCPSNANGIVGIKPTVGLVSRAGIIPISHTQDTAGPMARTVADAAALLTALAGVDPRDEATAAAQGRLTDYTRALDPTASRAPASASPGRWPASTRTSTRCSRRPWPR